MSDGREWTLHPTGHPGDLAVYVEPDWLPPMMDENGDEWWAKVTVVEKSRLVSAERELQAAREALREIASFTTQVGDTPHLVGIARAALSSSSESVE